MIQLFHSEDQCKYAYVNFNIAEMESHKGYRNLKYCFVVMYLAKHVQTFGRVDLTLIDLVKESGCAAKTVSAQQIDDFRGIIKNEILDKGYARADKDIDSVGVNEVFSMQLSFDNNLFQGNIPYVGLSIYGYDIMHDFIISNPENASKLFVLIVVYLTIKRYVVISSDSPEKGEIIKAQVSYPTRRQIVDSTGLSQSTIGKAVNNLCDMKLMKTYNNLYVQDFKRESYFLRARSVYAFNIDFVDEDTAVKALENFYKRPVYPRDLIPGKIAFYNN